MKSRQRGENKSMIDGRLLAVKCPNEKCNAKKGQKCQSMTVDGKERITWDEAVHNVRRAVAEKNQ